MKDSALAATSKRCEDCKERDFRLKIQLEELKMAIPRFLTKVTKVHHPKPTETQATFPSLISFLPSFLLLFYLFPCSFSLSPFLLLLLFLTFCNSYTPSFRSALAFLPYSYFVLSSRIIYSHSLSRTIAVGRRGDETRGGAD